ncbi:MAG TPA: PepSY domain-containing protein [Burkholderiales bacterium]
MKSVLLFSAAGLIALSATAPFAAEALPKTKAGLEKCMSAALEAHAGTVIKMEMKREKGVPTYEFDIESKDGKAWDIECDGNTGKITEVEEEVSSATEAQFAAKVKVTEEQARKTALERHAGEIIEVEYEIEPDGAASYEFDIRMADGKEHKVEVDATSGKIVEDNEELYQIGKE